MILQKNQSYEVTIEDLTYEGFGVARIDGFPVFVEHALPQERMTIRILKVLKKFAYGRVERITQALPDRVEITDKIGTRIGTMPLQHMSYDLQLRFKKNQVLTTLGRMVDLTDVEILETLGMENPWAYRNKAQIPVREIQGLLETGFFKRGSHDLIPVENFHIQDRVIDESILKVRNILRKYNVKAYDEGKHQGDMRHVIVRRGQVSGEIMLILVTRTASFKQQEALVADLVKEIPGLVSIIQNINPNKTNVIMGEVNKVLYGNDFYSDVLLGKTYAISSKSFYQVNTKQTEVLYQCAVEMANVKKQDIVVDAYCGIGTISLSLADHAKHVYAVEIVPDAIVMANYNARENNVDNVTFEVGKAEDVMTQWVADGLDIDVLVVDPPRKGLDGKFIEAAVQSNPDRIVYVSCNPATLARDLQVFVEKGYCVKTVQPVDMFPQTTHVETVVLMQRVGA